MLVYGRSWLTLRKSSRAISRVIRFYVAELNQRWD
jgi:hypothetical protein